MKPRDWQKKCRDLEAKISEQAKQILELERQRSDQRAVIASALQRIEQMTLAKRNAEDCTRLYLAQCRSARNDLAGIVSVLNSVFDVAYCFWSSSDGARKGRAAERVDALGDILDTLKLFDHFNEPRWPMFQQEREKAEDKALDRSL